MCGEDDAHAPGLEAADHGADRDAALGVDARRGFVEECHFGLPDQGQREGEALLLAAREVAPGRGGDRAQADEVEQLVGWHGVGVVPPEQVDDPARTEHRIDAAALEHDADATGEGGVVADGVHPEDPHRAGRRPSVALEGLDRRRLARPVGSEHDEYLAGCGEEVDPVHRRRHPRSVAHGETPDLDGRHGVAGYFEQR